MADPGARGERVRQGDHRGESGAHLAVGGLVVAAERLLRILEARAAAKESAMLTWPADPAREAPIVEALVARGASRRPNGLLTPAGWISEASMALAAAGIGPVTASRPDFVYETGCEAALSLRQRV